MFMLGSWNEAEDRDDRVNHEEAALVAHTCAGTIDLKAKFSYSIATQFATCTF